MNVAILDCSNPLNAELNPICHLLALFGAHHILHVSRIRANYYPGPEVETGGNNELLNVLLEKMLITDMKHRNPSTLNTAAICNVSLCNLWRYEEVYTGFW